MGVTRFRDTSVWIDQLDRLLKSEEQYASFVAQSRTLASRFLKGDSTRQLAQILNSFGPLRVPQYHNRKIIKLYGDHQKKTAFSLVNASWMHELKKIDGGPTCVGSKQSTSLELPDYVLHHNFEEKFLDFVPPEVGKCIAVRTWDFGHYPPAWVERINSTFDQLWVHSHWIKNQAIASGIDPARVRVVPLGFNPSIFQPQGEEFPLNTSKRFKFLFVGSTVFRKGIDILLEAYARAFTADDDVCLVIKDNSEDVFYKNISFKGKILDLMRNTQNPEILYINDFLMIEQLAALYRTCQVGIFPYRSEGFCIPILEAMGSGTPSIVPNFGPCLDFCSDETSFLVPVKRIHLPVHRQFLMNTLGFEEYVTEVDFCETKVEVLMKVMKQAFHTSEQDLNRLGSNGAKVTHLHFTWENSIAKFMQHLNELDLVNTPRRLENMRRENEKAYKKFEIAFQLYSEVRCETVNISSTA